MEVEIHIDRTRCIGSGQCVHVAPGAFDQDDQALAVVVDQRGEPEEKVARAVTACPVQAISLHVNGVVVGADDLRDWVFGARSEDPVVAVLGRLSEAHHELREALGASPPGEEASVAAISALTKAHLRDEEDAYAAITALVDPALVDSFEDDHGRIDRALDDLDHLTVRGADPVHRRRCATELATAIEDHIRLEETVLFPLALAALGRGRCSTIAALG